MDRLTLTLDDYRNILQCLPISCLTARKIEEADVTLPWLNWHKSAKFDFNPQETVIELNGKPIMRGAVVDKNETEKYIYFNVMKDTPKRFIVLFCKAVFMRLTAFTLLGVIDLTNKKVASFANSFGFYGVSPVIGETQMMIVRREPS